MAETLGQQVPDEALDRQRTEKLEALLQIAVDHLGRYRLGEGLPPIPVDRDKALIMSLIKGDLRFPPEIDIGDAEAAYSMYGSTGNAATEPKLVLYNGAQVAVMQLFEIINHREPSMADFDGIARGYACIARGLVEFTPSDSPETGTEVIHIRTGVLLTLAIGP